MRHASITTSADSPPRVAHTKRFVPGAWSPLRHFTDQKACGWLGARRSLDDPLDCQSANAEDRVVAPTSIVTDLLTDFVVCFERLHRLKYSGRVVRFPYRSEERRVGKEC